GESGLLRWSGGFADVELGGQLDPVGAQRPALDQVAEHLGGGAAHLGERLAHGGQRGRGPAADRQLVAADDGQVVGDAQPPLPGGLVDAEGLLVAAREDRRRPVGQVEQLDGAREAALVLEVAVPDQVRVGRDARPFEGRAVAVEPGQAAQHVSRPGDRADALVAEGQQVLGGGEPARPVRRADRRDVRRRGVGRVDDDERDAGPAQLPDLRACQRGGHQDDSVGVVAGDRRGPARRPGVAVPDRGHRDRDGVLRAPLLHAAQDLHRPGAVKPVEHKVDQSGAAVDAQPVAPVLVLVEQLLNPRAGGRRDVGPAVHHLGHSGQRHASLCGDRGEGRLPHGHTFRIALEIFGILYGPWNSAVLAASYGNRSDIKTLVTTWKRGVDHSVGRTYDGDTSKIFENFRKRLAPITPFRRRLCVAAAGHLPPSPLQWRWQQGPPRVAAAVLAAPATRL